MNRKKKSPTYFCKLELKFWVDSELKCVLALKLNTGFE